MLAGPVASRSKPDHNRAKVLAFIQANPGANGAAIVASTGLTRKQVDGSIDRLRQTHAIAPGSTRASGNLGKLYPFGAPQ